jgi:hypothetical protein
VNVSDDFVWGYLKGSSYRTNPHTVQELQAEIDAAAAEITGNVLHDNRQLGGSFTASLRGRRI